jgi:hypothetical protein
MKNTYVIRHAIRAIYISLASIFSIKIIIFTAVITNTTGLFPASFYHDTTIHDAKSRLINLLILFLSATAVYLLAEYAVYKQIAARSNESTIWAPSSKYILFMSYLYFTMFSFLTFLVTLHFISKNLFVIVIFTTLLNLIPIYLIYRLMLDELQIKNMKAIFWLTTVVMSIATVYPFGLIHFIHLFL